MDLNKGFWMVDQGKNEYGVRPCIIDKNSDAICFDFSDKQPYNTINFHTYL
jgi:hypothetical protein